jgi:hypothetical protein
VLGAIAEVFLIERELPTLFDAAAHAATIVLSRIGPPHDQGLLRTLSVFRPLTAWLDDEALAGETGQLGVAPEAARDVALVLRGLFVAAALDTDHGTWMMRGAAAEPDVVRVEVRRGLAGTADEVLRAHLAARRALDRAMELGGALPASPDAVLPVTRGIAYRPPLRPGQTWSVDLEDFSTGWVDHCQTR